MSEIKSTIDLMMERTRGMSLSVEERAALREEDLRKKAKGLRLKLLQEHGRAEEILSLLNHESEEDQRLLESILWKVMIDEMPSDSHVFKYLDLMEELPGASRQSQILHRLRDAFKEASKSQLTDKKKVITKEKKKLAALGISGNAVVPKIPKEKAASGNMLDQIAALQSELLAQTRT